MRMVDGKAHMGVSQNYGYLLRIPVIRIIVYWGPY